jgi:electron transport complex protein RnfD
MTRLAHAAPPSSPHTHGNNSVGRIMLLVWLALLPASLMGIYTFGWPTLNLLLITTAVALGAEAASLKLANQPIRPTLGDGTALLTGWLLAMTLPPWAPWWIAVVGALFAIVVGKQVFGGIGQNLFNPAMLGRVALLIAFPLEMTTWVAPVTLTSPEAPSFIEALRITFGGGSPVDSLSGATVLGHVKTELGLGHSVAEILSGSYDTGAAAMGVVRGSLGETSALLLLLGGLFLLGMRVISWHIPLAMLATLGGLATLMHQLDPQHYMDASVHLLSGGAMLGAFFIATDPVGSPSTPRGQLLFGAGCGLLIYVIRTWAGFPEGVAFAVLLMNAATPLIDHYVRPRIYGRSRDGEPLNYQQGRLARRLSTFSKGDK